MWIIFIQSYPHWLLVYPLRSIQHIVPPINYEAHFHNFLHFMSHYPCTLRRKNEEHKISRFSYKKEISNHSMRNHRGVNWNKMF